MNIVFNFRDANNHHVVRFPTSASCAAVLWFKHECRADTTVMHFLVWERWSRAPEHDCFHASFILYRNCFQTQVQTVNLA